MALIAVFERFWQHRRHGREAAAASLPMDAEPALAAPVAGRTVDRSELPAATGPTNRDALFAAALATLSSRQRAAILLRDGYDLSYADLAAALRLSPGEVGALLYQARERLLRAEWVLQDAAAAHQTSSH